MSIVTLTLSPCIDKSTSVPELIASKKLKCTNPKSEPGGGGINVARAIKKLGGEAIAVYPAGGYTGEAFNALLAAEKIDSLIVRTKSETRENIIVFEETSGNQYRFNMPAPVLLHEEWQQLVQAIEKIKNPGFIVASGSLPPGVHPNIFGGLAEIAKNKNAKLVVDTSGEALKSAAEKGVFLLKPNLGELSSLVGKEYLQDDEIEAAAKKVINNGSCEVIIVSMGEKGAMLCTKEMVRKVKPPAVNVKSTVGAGDSMVAGIVFLLSLGKNIEDAFLYGIASGTAATLHPGTELCTKEDTERLFAQIS